MFKLKNFKIEFKHLLTAVAAVGMVAGFIAALCSKKKAAACAAFFASFAALIAGLGMETGVVPEPECCKKLEFEIGQDDEDDWSFDEEDYGDFGADVDGEEKAQEETPAEDGNE